MEIWKDIENFDNYQVSNYGRVCSTKYKQPRILSGDLSDGYHRVKLSLKGISHRVSVHRLVAKYFLDCFQEHLVVNHKDGNKLNNRADNLECITHAENIQHAVDTGLLVHRSREYKVLGKLKVLEIFKLLHENELTSREIAVLYSVDISTIHCISARKTYKKVINPYKLEE